MALNAPYSPEPENKQTHTERFDQYYTKFASLYDWTVKNLPVWRNWITQVIPYIQGPRVLEISFGTGYLLTQYAAQFEAYGIDYNQRMVQKAKQNLAQAGVTAALQRADVEALPYKSGIFDSVVNTMAFSGYPDGVRAMSEMCRVLRPGGRLLLIDVNYPGDGNRLGRYATRFWAGVGDIIRNMESLFDRFGFEYTDKEIGGFGSVHLYVAEK